MPYKFTMAVRQCLIVKQVASSKWCESVCLSGVWVNGVWVEVVWVEGVCISGVWV